MNYNLTLQAVAFNVYTVYAQIVNHVGLTVYHRIERRGGSARVVRAKLGAVSPTVPAGADSGLLSVAELAKFLSISENTLRQWCAQGRIPHGKFEGTIRFDRDQVQEWIDERWNNTSKKD